MLELGFFLSSPGAAFGFDAITAHRGQNTGGLLATHDANTGVGPHPQKPRIESAATHAVVARAITAANDEGEFGHLGTGHRRHHLGAMPSNALVFILATHHEAGDVLQKHQGDFALAAQLDEVRSFLRRLGKQDAVVGDDAHRHALDMGEAAHQGAAKTWFEFMQLRAVHHPRNDFTHVIGLAGVGGNHAMQLLHVEKRRTGFLHRQLNVFASIQARHSLAGQGNRVGIVVGQMVGHARQTGVHIAAA